MLILIELFLVREAVWFEKFGVYRVRRVTIYLLLLLLFIYYSKQLIRTSSAFYPIEDNHNWWHFGLILGIWSLMSSWRTFSIILVHWGLPIYFKWAFKSNLLCYSHLDCESCGPWRMKSFLLQLTALNVLMYNVYLHIISAPSHIMFAKF